MTFLQQTLGRNYKWWYIVKYHIAVANSGLVASLIGSFPKILSALMIVFVWSKSNPSVAIFTYLIVGRIYRSVVESYSEVIVSRDIINGNLTSQLVLPNSYFGIMLFTYIGRRVFRNFLEILTFIITAVISIYFFSPIQLSNISNIFWILLFVPVSFFINFALGYIVGNFAFFLKDSREFNSVQDGWLAINAILYGLIIPLSEMPFSRVFTTFPTAYFVHHPMQIYLGKYSQVEILYTFASGIAWCLVLWIMAQLVFKAGLKRNEAVGL
jgi:ABC-2 type transport system permease protein